MAYSITKKELSPQPVLVVRRRIKPSDVPVTLAEVLGKVFMYAQQERLRTRRGTAHAVSGMGTGIVDRRSRNAGDGQYRDACARRRCSQKCCPADWWLLQLTLSPTTNSAEAHAALQQWIEAENFTASTPTCNLYATDPADYPDPKDWKTELFWPISAS